MRTLLAPLVACLALAATACSSPDQPAREPYAAPATASSPTSPSAQPAAEPATTKPEPPALRPRLTVRRGIDWERVGPGWHLVGTWSGPRRHGSIQPEDARLQLLGPTGRRIDVVRMDQDLLPSTSAPGWATAFPQVVDLSAADHTVLLLFHSDFRDATVVALDLATGRQRRARVPAGTSGAVLREGGFTYVGFRGRVVSVDWDGTATPLGHTDGAVLPLVDGSGVVTARPVRVLSYDGTRRPLPDPVHGKDTCEPRRWWDDATVLTACTDGSLWLLPLDGGRPLVLTGPADPGATRIDFGADDAVRLGEATFVQKLAGCGAGWIARRNPDGTTTDLDGVREQRVVGAVGDRLVVLRHGPCGMTGAQVPLVLLDPVTLDARPLLETSAGEALWEVRPWAGLPAAAR